MNELIYDGRKYTDEDESLYSAGIYLSDSLVAESLGVDTLTAEVIDYQLQTRLLASDGMLAAADGMLLSAEENDTGLKRYSYGAPVEYRHNDALIGKFYLEQINRIGTYRYKIGAISAVGLLLTDNYYGGVYSGISVAELIKDIVGGVFQYTIDSDFGAEPVYGLLKKATRRDSLRDVLFAQGGQIRKDSNGDVAIGPQIGLTPYNITPDEFYRGGSVAGLTPASAIKLTEHTYLALDSDETVTLFDGEAAAEELTTPMGKSVTGVLVEFSDPMHNLQATNVEILESGANYAILSQSPSATLTGQKYTHIERVLTRSQKTGATPNVVSSNACTLVNMLNSENVVDRLMAYYGSAKEIEADLVVTTQKTGDAVDFMDPYGDETSGYISELDITMSSILKARATLVSGYIPGFSGNFYEHVLVITETKKVSIPAENKGKARLVLISGGQGGEDGANGESGSNGSSSSGGNGGAGGLAGKGGVGGRIFIITIPVKTGQTFSAVVGAGGVRGENGVGGSLGEDSKFGEYTTANGLPATTGHYNLISGEIYGTPGTSGINGGNGSGPDEIGNTVIDDAGNEFYPGENGTNSSSWEGARGGGGYGGGAAVGSNGEDGRNGRVQVIDEKINPIGGDGGAGASAINQVNATIPGSGGPGGHGGGGGGGGGFASGGSSSELNSWGWGGDPGIGGLAGNGAPGIILVYY